MKELFAGIDLGGTNIKAALADREGTVVVRETVPTESQEGPRAVVDRIGDIVEKLKAQAGAGRDRPLAGLGIGAPGRVDMWTGATRFLPNMPTQWRDTPVGEWLTARLGCHVRLLNDARAATLGELRYGHGRGLSRPTMAFFGIGTGIGGGVAIDGHLRLGPFGDAGEFGHQTIAPEGPPCGCGNHGCLEALASGPAIAAEGVRLVRAGLAPRLFELIEGDVGRLTPREMGMAADQGDHLVRASLERAANFLGIAAANLVTTLHPQWIILGGGVAGLGDVLLNGVRQAVRQRVGMFPTDDVRVERSLLGTHAGLMGAIALAIDGVAP